MPPDCSGDWQRKEETDMNQAALKLIALFSALALVFSLTACDGLPSEEETTTEPPVISKTAMPTANEEVLAYFNRLVNAAKKSNSKFTMSKEPMVSEVEASNQTLESLVPTLQQLMLNKTQVSSENGKTLSEVLPVSGQEWASRLTSSDIRYAQCVQEDDLYKIMIFFNEEDEPAPLTSNHGKAFDMEDRAAIEKEFQKAKDYMQLGDYSVRFVDSTIACEIDRTNDEIQKIIYNKRMRLKAQATGVGQLASAGQINLSCVLEIRTEFNLTWEHPEDTVAQ